MANFYDQRWILHHISWGNEKQARSPSFTISFACMYTPTHTHRHSLSHTHTHTSVQHWSLSGISESIRAILKRNTGASKGLTRSKLGPRPAILKICSATWISMCTIYVTIMCVDVKWSPLSSPSGVGKPVGHNICKKTGSGFFFPDCVNISYVRGVWHWEDVPCKADFCSLHQLSVTWSHGFALSLNS